VSGRAGGVGDDAPGELAPSRARLVRPHARFRSSFIAALVECHREGRHQELDELLLGDRDEFGRYVAALLADEHSPGSMARYVASLGGVEAPHMPDGYVPQTLLWWVEGDEYLGRLTLRHRLTVRLAYEGGHVGYEVRPSARGRGHATAMVGAALPLLAGLGMQRALIDCDPANLASRRVIEKNGGEFDGEWDDELYFWVPTAPRRDGA
jgi:predicted acetyltransferase